MDGHHFDEITKAMACGTSRRRLLKILVGGAAGGLVAMAGRHESGAFICRDLGVLCAKDAQCCSGRCDPATHRCVCPAGFANCDGNQANGCETDLLNDVANCGACSHACPSAPVCRQPVCVDGACDTAADPGQNGVACDDGNACTLSDHCQDGSCVGTAVVCPTPDQCHEQGTCDSSTGLCSNPAKPDGAACDDGNPCTVNDTCQGGSCVSGTRKDCSSLADQCNDAVCDQSSGQCVKQAKANGTSCNDGDACTTGDTCQDGTCAAGQRVSCPTCQRCANGACVADASDPACGTVCCNGTCCGSGQVCDFTSGTCAAGSCVGQFQPCPNGGCCTGLSCAIEPGGQFCQKFCSSAGECGPSQPCCAGRCCQPGLVCDTAGFGLCCAPQGAHCPSAPYGCCNGPCTNGVCP